MSIVVSMGAATARSLDLARVLLVESDVASRLTLQTLLEAGGYSVDVAASAADSIPTRHDRSADRRTTGRSDSRQSGRRACDRQAHGQFADL